MKKIVIIGAGPAGVLLANYLLNRDLYQVEIYERLDNPLTAKVRNERTFPLALSRFAPKAEGRGQEAGGWLVG